MKIVRKKIEMLCWFDLNGHPHPIRFRLLDENENYVTIKIDHIIKIDKEKLAGQSALVYTCESTIHHVRKILVLKYYPDTGQWMLYKI